MEILKDDILQLNFHTFIESWAQFKELHGPFVNLGAHLPQKHNSPILILPSYSWRQLIHVADKWFMSLQKLNKEYENHIGLFLDLGN